MFVVPFLVWQAVLLMSCILAFFLNYSIFLNTTLNSALTQTICGNLKVCLSVFLTNGLICFTDFLLFESYVWLGQLTWRIMGYNQSYLKRTHAFDAPAMPSTGRDYPVRPLLTLPIFYRFLMKFVLKKNP